MVRIFQILNGSQDSELIYPLPRRFLHEFHEFEPTYETEIKKSMPPDFLIPYKGGLAVSLTREFVHFLLTNPIAKSFYRWCNTTDSAEEHFWSTMIHNLHVKPPSGYPGIHIIVGNGILSIGNSGAKCHAWARF